MSNKFPYLVRSILIPAALLAHVELVYNLNGCTTRGPEEGVEQQAPAEPAGPGGTPHPRWSGASTQSQHRVLRFHYHTELSIADLP